MNCCNFITPIIIILVISTHLVKGFHHALKVTLQARTVTRTKGTMTNKLLGIALGMHFAIAGEEEIVNTSVLTRAFLRSQDKHR